VSGRLCKAGLTVDADFSKISHLSVTNIPGIALRAC
jgi:hypothetical protein